jgi:hypothetical protein
VVFVGPIRMPDLNAHKSIVIGYEVAEFAVW